MEATAPTKVVWSYIDMKGLEATVRLALAIEKHFEKYPESKRVIRDLVMEKTNEPEQV